MTLRSWATGRIAGARARCVGAIVTFAFAVGFRVALFFSGAVAILFETGDSPEYRALAKSILLDHVFGLDGVPKMNRTPGYPAFLAATFATLGSSQLAVTGAQVVLDALTCVMVFDLAVRLRLRRAAVFVATGLAITCVFSAALSFQMMTETLYTFAIVASVWLLPTGPIAAVWRSRNRWRLLASGIAMSAAALVRPLEAFTVPVFGLILAAMLVRRFGARRVFASPKRRWSLCIAGALFVVGASSLLGPWMLRNRIVFHWEFEKPNHEHVTLLGYKTDVPVYRHWYSREFTFFRRSYEEPMVMETPYEAPSIARWVYPEEPHDVAEAFASLSREIRASELEPISAPTLAAFEEIGKKRYAFAPRLYLTAPLSRAAKLWIAPRASILLKDQHGGKLQLRTTIGLTLYDLVYVVPGLIGLAFAFRRSKAVRAAIVATVVAHTAMHTFWHSSPHSRYMMPMFPLLCLGIGAALDWGLRSRTVPPRGGQAVGQTSSVR